MGTHATTPSHCEGLDGASLRERHREVYLVAYRTRGVFEPPTARFRLTFHQKHFSVVGVSRRDSALLNLPNLGVCRKRYDDLAHCAAQFNRFSPCAYRKPARRCDGSFERKGLKLVPQFHAEAVDVLVATPEADHRVAAKDDRVGQRQLVANTQAILIALSVSVGVVSHHTCLLYTSPSPRD